MALNAAPTTAARNVALLLTTAPRRITAQFVRYHNTSSSSSPPPPPPSSSSSVSSDELRHFASLASSWWDPLGPSRILHLMNPVRHDFIASCLAETQSRPERSSSGGSGDYASSDTKGNGSAGNSTRDPGLKYLDIGCGGGIFAESMARTIPPDTTFPTDNGTTVTPQTQTQTRASSLLAIDPSPDMIDVALSHARKDPTLHSHLRTGRFRYENRSLEDLVSKSNSSSSPSSSSSFDVITLFEVLEHTSSPRSFLAQCLRILNRGGWLIGSTIARTWPSFVVNQVIAEATWPIGVVPRGTHEWSKFVNADEVKGWAEEGLMATRGGEGLEEAYASQMGWRSIGAVYVPGLGWKLVPGGEAWGNYFWGVQKTV